jgi:hypothetical protein
VTDPRADRVGEATVRRFIDREHDVLVTVGDFGPLFDAYLEHVRRWESTPDGLAQTIMRQGLGAAVLHLSGRPRGELVGWTIHLNQPPTNVFLAGDSGELTVTGRVFTDKVDPLEASRMYVQISRNGAKPIQSMVEVKGLDLLHIFEQYYERSEQTPARFFEITDREFLMILGLPDTDLEWLRRLTREEALGVAEDELKSLGGSTYRFLCGCTASKILEVVRGMFRDDPDELFRGDEGVEIFCPRCGRRWWVERAQFGKGSASGGA